MSETPSYVMEAVRQLFEEKKPARLIEMFCNGLPLHTYPESRELIEKLLREEKLRGRGHKPANYAPAKQARDISIQIAVAQLVGALGPVIHKGEATLDTPTACKVVAKWHGLSQEGVEKIWNKVKDSEWVESHKQFGRENAEQFLDGL